VICSGSTLVFVTSKPVGKSHLSLTPLEDATSPLAIPLCCEDLAAAAIVRHCLRGTYFCHCCQSTWVFLLLGSAVFPDLH